MPITKSAKRALRQSIRRAERNTEKKNTYRALLKKIEKAVGSKNMQDAKSTLSLFYKAVDKAAKTHTIAKNKASRLKSRASKLIAKTFA